MAKFEGLRAKPPLHVMQREETGVTQCACLFENENNNKSQKVQVCPYILRDFSRKKVSHPKRWKSLPLRHRINAHHPDSLGVKLRLTVELGSGGVPTILFQILRRKHIQAEMGKCRIQPGFLDNNTDAIGRDRIKTK